MPMNRCLKISQIDAMFADGSYPIEFLLFFDRAFDTARLRSALGRLQRMFWPAFGTYRNGEIACEGPGEAGWYREETVDEELPLPDDELEGWEAYRSLSIDESDRLFVLKVVRYRNGLALVPRLSHLAGDGYSYFYLLSVVAGLTRLRSWPDRMLRSRIIPLVYRPHHRRTVLRDFAYADPGTSSLPEDERDLTTIHEEIPKAEVRSILKSLSTERDARVSTNDYLSAVALKRLITTNRSRFGDEVGLTIPIDVRRKIKEYGARFFGNGIMLHTQYLDVSLVERTDPGAIALDIRKGLPDISKEVYLGYLAGLENRIADESQLPLRPYDPERGCLVTNLSRLPSDRLDFGTGPPRLVTNLTTGRNGTVILSRGDDFVLRMIY